MTQYAPSTTLFKVDLRKLVKVKQREEWTEHEVAVVAQAGRSIEELNAIASTFNTSRKQYTVKPIWIGWTVGSTTVDDDWLIAKYGQLDDLMTKLSS